MTWDTSGFVGIGTTAPAASLELYRSDTAVTDQLRITQAGTGDPAMMFHVSGVQGWYVGVDNSASESFYINTGSGNTGNGINILTNGSVGIGTTAPGTYRLFVYNDIAGDFVASFRNDGNNANRHGIEVRGGADDGSGVTYYFAAQDGDGNGIGSLENNNGTFQLVDGSDARYKRDITDTVITGIDTLNKVRVIDFTRQKSDDRVIGGFSAQELLEVYPSAVSGTEDDVDEKGMPRPMGVAKDTFIPVLVKAIQELSVKVAALEAA